MFGILTRRAEIADVVVPRSEPSTATAARDAWLPTKGVAAVLSAAAIVLVSLGVSCLEATAFPLWPKGKPQAKQQPDDDANDKANIKANEQAKSQANDKGKSKAQVKDQVKDQVKEQTSDQGSSPSKSAQEEQADDEAQAKEKAAADSAAIDAIINKLNSGQPSVPIDFVPTVGGGRAANDGGKATTSLDPMAIYRSCGVSPVEERKIRQLAQDFEGMQRVRLKLLITLMADLRSYELQTDPDPKAVMAKQDEINKVTDAMVVERMKLLLAIRDIMTFEEKQRLVETLQREKR
jgi:hypothetical protein